MHCHRFLSQKYNGHFANGIVLQAQPCVLHSLIKYRGTLTELLILYLTTQLHCQRKYKQLLQNQSFQIKMSGFLSA